MRVYISMGDKILKNIVLLGLLLVALPSYANDASVTAARQVMNEFLAAFNERDESRWADTLLFPHVRVASNSVSIVPDKKTFLSTTDLEQFAIDNDWDFSEWDSIEVIQSGPNKVHFKVKFSRFNPRGERYVTFDSLYVVQKVGERWGIRARSSFAP
ncbi:MAG: hypothetical protein ACI9ON_002123 [Limisphaerales bacterium]